MNVGTARAKAAEPMNPRVTSIRTQAEASLAEQFAERDARAPATAELAALRAASFESFRESGLPSRRVEAWHYTDLRGALREALPLFYPEAGALGASDRPTLARPGAIRLVLLDGVFRPDLSERAEGLNVRSLAEALAQGGADLVEALVPPGLARDPMVALNAAFMDRGVMIEVAAGAQIERPVELVWISEDPRPQAIFARSLLRLGEGSRLTLVESTGQASAARQINAAFFVSLAENARLDYVRTAAAQPSSLRIESFAATLKRGAQLNASSLVADSPFLRRQTYVRFDGENAKASLAGLSLLRGSEHADNTLLIEHIAPHCESREKFKHIVEGEATGVFQGKIVVAPGAQKTDGVMASRAILLSPDASMYNKPELEIFADDVVCGHGATCGDLDEDLLFYAMARGLPRPDAEALLLEAFAEEALQSIEDEVLRETLSERMRAWLAQRGM